MREKAEQIYNKIGGMREKVKEIYNKTGDIREKAGKTYNKIGGLNTIVALLLILLIALISIICPQVSLSGLSTFGLLIVALQALSFTKEQALEWRRKGAYNELCNFEKILEEHSVLINGYLTASQDNKTPEITFEQAKRASQKTIEDFNVFNEDMIDATEKLITVENHFTILGKESISELRALIIQIKRSANTIRFLPDSTDDPKYLDLAKQEAENINQKSNFLLKSDPHSKPRALMIYVKGLKASATEA